MKGDTEYFVSVVKCFFYAILTHITSVKKKSSPGTSSNQYAMMYIEVDVKNAREGTHQRKNS